MYCDSLLMFESLLRQLDYCKYLQCLSCNPGVVFPSISKYFQNLPKYQSENIRSIYSFSQLQQQISLPCADCTHQHHINSRTKLHGSILCQGCTDHLAIIFVPDRERSKWFLAVRRSLSCTFRFVIFDAVFNGFNFIWVMAIDLASNTRISGKIKFWRKQVHWVTCYVYICRPLCFVIGKIHMCMVFY